MKVFAVFILFIAVTVAFPSAETKPELQPEQHQEQQNTLLSAEGNPKGDNAESDADRAKRFIFLHKYFVPWPVYTSVVAAPAVYAAPVVTKTVTRTVAAPAVVTKTYTAPVVTQTYAVPQVETAVAAAPVVATGAVVKSAGVHVSAPFVDVSVG